MEELNNMQKKCYVTVDFEDFSHDFKRSVLFEKDPKINEEALNKSYEYIKYLLNKLNNIKITFFCAGILAKKYPDVSFYGTDISEEAIKISSKHYQMDNLHYEVCTATNIVTMIEKYPNRNILSFSIMLTLGLLR